MNVHMTHAEFDALPDRQKLTGVPVFNECFRDSAHPNTVFLCNSEDHQHNPRWAAFGVYFCDK
jgi:hypothetical protein